ncbi:DUF4189 domain-containing protein [Nocardia sp. NPDC050406]|uniref:DUF4189 domain-containing protein n=1 Tax=Nocardia sp. NPDC050406 TaxID=3364318 RepID=UPI0037BCC50D
MSLLRKSALAMVVPAAGVLVASGAGTAHAAGDLYGAIAVSGGRTIGEAWDFPTQAAADDYAIAQCGNANVCTVKVRFHNECGSVAGVNFTAGRNAPVPVYYGGTGPTREAAEQAARAAAGPTYENPWLPMVWLGSTAPAQVQIVDTLCTANAG